MPVLSEYDDADGLPGAVPLWPMRRPPAWQLASLALAVCAGASVGQWLSHDGGQLASLWPPNGVAVAVLLMSEPHCWLGFLAAAWLGNTIADAAFGNPVGFAAAMAGINALEILAIAFALRWRLGGRASDLTRANSLLWFGAVAGVLVTSAIALIAAAVIHAVLGRPYWTAASTWYLAHVLGLSITVPIMLTFRQRQRTRLGLDSRLTLLALGVFVATTVATFMQTDLPLLFLPTLPLMWVVVRLGASGAAASLAVLAAVALPTTLNGFGPLAIMADTTLHGKILFLQFYLLVVATKALGVAAVMAERARLSMSVERSAGMFRLLAEHASDVISRVGPDGNRFYISPTCERLLGFPPEVLLGKSMFGHIHPDDRETGLALQRRLLSGHDEVDHLVYRAIHAKGHQIWLESSVRLLHDTVSGAPDGYVTVMRDVTEREERAAELAQGRRELETSNAQLDRLARHLARARDQADQANVAKSAFVASMSHELRTPLNGILGYAQLLRLEGGLNPTQSERVEAMLRAGRHLLELVNNVLDVSQIEAGRVDVLISEVDAVELCRTCLELVRPAAIEKHLALDIVAAPGLPPVRADRGRLRQVMVNLLGNAIKFTPSGSVTLHLSHVADLADPTMVRLAVADTGPGVSAAKRDKLFQQFQRLGASAGPLEGAGLGLAISRHLIELMEGQIGFEDNAPTGSVFWLELPAVDAAPSSGLPAATTAHASGSMIRLHTLVVDDVSMNRDVAKAFLRAGGHHAVCVDSGEEAVAQAKARDFDVVLMDIRMPGMDGLEATRQIRALPGIRGRVPIVALTANAFLDQVQECRAAGMDAHIVKPFDHTTLLDTVHRVVTVERAAAEAASPRQTNSPVLAALGLAPAAPSRIEIAAPLGDSSAALDQAAFDRTAALLDPQEVLACLRTLQGRGTAIQNVLADADSMSDTAWLSEAAHTMAGSAGMFGFLQVVATSRALERALAGAAADQMPAAHAVESALAAMQTELSRHMEELELSTTGGPR